MNGQVVLWDIASYQDRIANPRGDHRDKDLFIVSNRISLKYFHSLDFTELSSTYIITKY